MGNDCGDGTGEVCSFVGAGVGIDDGFQLCDGDGRVGGLIFGQGIFINIGLGAEDGMWLGEDGGIGDIVEIFGAGGITDEGVHVTEVGSLVGVAVHT